MKRGFTINKHEKILFITVIFIIIIVAVAIALGKNVSLKGAATVDNAQPLFNLKMDYGSLLEKEVLKSRGVHETVNSGGKLKSRGDYETANYGGKIDNAWKFDGNDDYVITSSNHLKELEDFTIMLWMQPTDSSFRKRAHILWQGEFNEVQSTLYGGNGWGPEQELHLSLGDELGINKYNDRLLTFYFGDDNDNIKISTPLKIPNWQHVAVTVRNHRHWATAELFLDGSSVGKQRIARNIDRKKWESTLILGKAGRDGPATDSDRFYSGLVDELTIYDRILPAREISSICRQQNNGDLCGS